MKAAYYSRNRSYSRSYNAECAEATAQQAADNVAGIMRRMADWYKAYLIWEDNEAEHYNI